MCGSPGILWGEVVDVLHLSSSSLPRANSIGAAKDLSVSFTSCRTYRGDPSDEALLTELKIAVSGPVKLCGHLIHGLRPVCLHYRVRELIRGCAQLMKLIPAQQVVLVKVPSCLSKDAPI